MTASCLYDAVVVHQRMRPVTHRLRYRVLTLLLDLDEVPALARRLWLFSHNRANLISFHDRDHGAGTPSGLRGWVEARLREGGIVPDGGAIRLLCMPRVFGHAFNPLSVFFCHDRDGALAAVLYEVNNTFGQRHSYLMAVPDQARPLRQSCDKCFYVSPFLPMDLTYHFRVDPPGEAVSIAIAADGADGRMLSATLHGRRKPLSDAALLAGVAGMQILGLKVIAGIHWEALKLWRKGLRLHHRPPPPAHPVTLGR